MMAAALLLFPFLLSLSLCVHLPIRRAGNFESACWLQLHYDVELVGRVDGHTKTSEFPNTEPILDQFLPAAAR